MIDPELDARLSAIEKKLDENVAILSQMRRVQRNANIMKLLYWLVIIGLAIIAISTIKPYLEQLGAAYGITPPATVDQSSSPSSSINYAELFKQFKELQQNQ